MNIIKGTIAAAAVITCCLGNQLPAYSAPKTCALSNTKYDYVHKFTCDHSMRVNANGHNVHDVVFYEENKRYDMSIVLWTVDGDPEYAEVFVMGKRSTMRYYVAENGVLCLVTPNDKLMCII